MLLYKFTLVVMICLMIVIQKNLLNGIPSFSGLKIKLKRLVLYMDIKENDSQFPYFNADSCAEMGFFVKKKTQN